MKTFLLIASLMVSQIVFAQDPTQPPPAGEPAAQNPPNPQVQADREKLKADRKEMHEAKKQLRQDRRQLRKDRKAAHGK